MKPKLNSRTMLRVEMECIGSDLAWLLGACVLLRARDNSLRDRGLQRSDVGEIATGVRAHVLPVREQHDRQPVLRHTEHVRSRETSVIEAPFWQAGGRHPAEEVLILIP